MKSNSTATLPNSATAMAVTFKQSEEQLFINRVAEFLSTKSFYVDPDHGMNHASFDEEFEGHTLYIDCFIRCDEKEGEWDTSKEGAAIVVHSVDDNEMILTNEQTLHLTTAIKQAITIF